MKFEKKHAALLMGVALWNVWTWGTFIKNLSAAYERGEQHPTGYWVAHTILIIVNFVIAGVLGALGWKAWRSADQDA
ncbi:SCO4848 family membrane protein [Nocardioides jiangxiensis]|uniref:Uncharacterized protein n=1 Tax=Nocardioides jiangxiensis TaxID=3064524 RepID=A0ABT9AZZ9_9ACTN|nr:hypothetical protein [Nocardioides sp. WY-20]MDO7867553.1 hypothetical protein [Nocardioides sp. WY-20]